MGSRFRPCKLREVRGKPSGSMGCNPVNMRLRRYPPVPLTLPFRQLRPGMDTKESFEDVDNQQY